MLKKDIAKIKKIRKLIDEYKNYVSDRLSDGLEKKVTFNDDFELLKTCLEVFEDYKNGKRK